MKAIFMSGSPRANVGKKDAKALRVSNLVPCVLYGGKEQIHFSIPEKDFKPLIFTPDVHTVELDLSGAKYTAILQDVQYHPISDKILHVDFLQTFEDKPVIINIPVKVTGNAPGVRAGGKLIVKRRTLKVKSLLKSLPDFISIDISTLEIGDSVKVSELISDDLLILEALNVDVVAVTATRASRQAESDGKK
jgi:large subunit ribosomal protein L25